MNKIKPVVTTILYTVFLIIFLRLINEGLTLLIAYVIFPLFKKFYLLDLFWQWLIGFGVGLALIVVISQLFVLFISTVINYFNSFFPFNKVISIISGLLVLINIVLTLIGIFRVFSLFSWDFWIICLQLILCVLAIVVNIFFVRLDD